MRKDENRAGQWNYRQMGDFKRYSGHRRVSQGRFMGEGSGISCQVSETMTVQIMKMGDTCEEQV